MLFAVPAASPSPPDALMLPVERVAELLGGVCVRTVERMVKRGEFPSPRKLGRRTLWPRAAVEAWVNDPDAARATGCTSLATAPPGEKGLTPPVDPAVVAVKPVPPAAPSPTPAEAPGVALVATSDPLAVNSLQPVTRPRRSSWAKSWPPSSPPDRHRRRHRRRHLRRSLHRVLRRSQRTPRPRPN